MKELLMSAELKKIWDELKAESENRAGPLSMDYLSRLDVAMEPVYQLLKSFERERAHQAFTSSAPCPVCDIGTVTYKYIAPLIGNMKCDNCEYVKVNL